MTICTRERRCLLGTVRVGRDAYIPPHVELTAMGKIVEHYIENMNFAYEYVAVDKYVIMPNHIHLLITIADPQDGGMRVSRPTLRTLVRSLKTMVTKRVGYRVWQGSYYDTVIRDAKGYQEIWQYIEENPLKWQLDELYMA